MPSFRATRFIPSLFVVLWATGFIGTRYAMPWAQPFGFLAARFAAAGAILMLLSLALGARRPGARQAAHAALVGALVHGVYLGGVFWAIRNGMPAGLSALIVGLQPLVMAVMAGVALGETVLPRHWAGLAVGFAGIVVVLWPKLGDALGGVTTATLAASVVGVIGISAGAVWQKRFLAGGDLVATTLWQYVGATAVVATAALLFESGEFVLNGELAFAFAWLVLVLSIGAIFLLMYMIREGEMAKVSSLFYLVPAATALMAWPLFGETLTPLQLLGMAVTTVGVAMATRR
jgi:drug/metabolite transporter (DMT)-like permease